MGNFKSRIYNFFIIFMIITVILTLPVYLIYENIKGIVISELGKSSINISVATASFIEQNIEPYKELTLNDKYKTGDYDIIYYKKMQETFQTIRKKSGVDFIFTLRKISDTKVAYILDGEEPDSKLFSPIGTEYNMSDTELRVFNEGIIISTDLEHNDVWGEFITGFAPIIDYETDEVIGIVGTIFSIKYVRNMINGIKTIILISILIIILLVTIVVNKILFMRAKSLETDYLTGLYSKSYYEQHLNNIIRDSKKKRKIFSVVMIDIDNFKEINDQHGHVIGDKVLKSISEIMKTNMRSFDICSRYGGDEFIVILPDTKKKHAVLISERILEKVFSLDFHNDGITISVSLSIGIAEWEHYMSAERLIECADQAMYISKNTGKNKVTVYKS